MNLTTLHVFDGLTHPDEWRQTRVATQLRTEAAAGGEVHALGPPEFLAMSCPSMVIHELDPEDLPHFDDPATTAATHGLVALSRALDMTGLVAELVIAHTEAAMPGASAIAARLGAPLVRLDHSRAEGPVLAEERFADESAASRAAVERYRQILTRESGQEARPELGLVVLADGLEWEHVEPMLLHLPGVRILKGAPWTGAGDLSRATVVAVAAGRGDALAVARDVLASQALPILVGEGGEAGLTDLERVGCLVRCSREALPEVAVRWLSDAAGRARMVAAGRRLAPASRSHAQTETTSAGTTTVTVTQRSPRPLRVLLNHGGLVAQELASSLTGLGWELRPLLGEGRDPLVSADFMIVLPYGDPRGALTAVQRAARLGVPSAFWNVEDPRYFLDPELGPTIRELARAASLTFSSTAQLDREYRALGVEVSYLPVYGRSYLQEPEPLPDAQRVVDLLFLGTLTPEREQFLEELRRALGEGVSLLVRDDLREPEAVRAAVRAARLGLSFGTLTDCPGARGEGVTERVFDYPLAGTPVLSDERLHLGELFEVGDEVFTFRDAVHAAEQARALLADPDRRERAALRARRKVLGRHLGRHRVLAIARRLLERGFLAEERVGAAVARAEELARLERERTEAGGAA